MIDATGKRGRNNLREEISSVIKRILLTEDSNVHQETFWALRDISLDVCPGEAVGIMGPNGSGKSTLLKILARVVQPTSGRAVLCGRIGSILEIGTGFHSELTGRENIFISGAVLGMKQQEIREKFDEIVNFSGVERFLDMPVKRYSSGMQVRLAFSVAAHFDPEILLVDEVLAVGDVDFQHKCIEKMKKSLEEGVTLLFVSHNIDHLSDICDRGIIINKGRMSFSGRVNEATELYRTHALAGI
jgi:lipopolysaccharide transport system ATP-binding protein